MRRNNSIIEIRVEPKKMVGSGVEHNVYPSIKNPDSVYKVKKDSPKIRMSWVHLFQEHPEIFPKVLNIKDNYVTLEKLDTKKAISEYDVLDSLMRRNSKIYEGDFAYTFFLIKQNRADCELSEVDEYFKSFGNKLYSVYSKWRDLITKFLDIMPSSYYSDLHRKQFGYSKDGTLKILDF